MNKLLKTIGFIFINAIFTLILFSLIVKFAPIPITNLLLNPIAVVKGLQHQQEAEYKKEEQDAEKKFKQTLETKKAQIYSDSAPYFGNKDAKVKVVLFYDYRCGYCKALAETLTNIMKEEKYSANVKFIARDFPILSSASGLLAIASLQSFKANPEKFFEVHEALFKTDGSEGAINETLKKITGKTADFKNVDEQRKTIEENLKLGSELGIRGTPAMIIGDEFIGGLISEGDFRARLDAQLAK